MFNFVTAYLGGTHGTAKSACDFLWAMLCHESRVRVQTPDQVCIPTDIAMVFGQKIHHLRSDGQLNRTLRPSRWFRRIPRRIAANVHSNLIRSRDHVIVNGWASLRFWNQVSSQYRGPKTIIVRESPSYFEITNGTVTPQEAVDVLSDFDCMIFVSDVVRREWLRHGCLSGKRTYVLPNCCEEEGVLTVKKTERAEVRAQLGFSPDDFVITCPSRLEFAKGQDLIIEALPLISRGIPNLRIVFVGPAIGAYGAELAASIANLDDCEWVGEKRSVLDYIYAADIMLFPSRTEALPRTVLEAMAIGTPIIASGVGGIPELVKHNDSGLVFSVGDQQELLTNVLRLAASADVRQLFASRAFKRYWSTFSKEQQVVNARSILEALKVSARAMSRVRLAMVQS